MRSRRNLEQPRLALLVLEHPSASWLASAEDSAQGVVPTIENSKDFLGFCDLRNPDPRLREFPKEWSDFSLELVWDY